MKIIRRIKEWLPSDRTLILFPIIHCILYEVLIRVSIFGTWREFYCALDEKLPLVKWFMIPYVSWFFFIGFAAWYFWKTDRTQLRRYVKCLLISVIPVYFVFIFFPTCLPLRPERMEGSGILPLMFNFMFAVDVPHDIFPSLHVIWAAITAIALAHSERFSSRGWKAALCVITVLISVSTFMVKQHSVLDTPGAIPFVLLGWYLTYTAGCA